MHKQKSLKAHVEESMELFLANCGFALREEFFHGVILMLDLLSLYKEEGKELYPEVFILHNNKSESLFKFINGEKREEVFSGVVITVNSFKKILKALAPLCSNGWICYFEIHADGHLMNAGIISVAENETSVAFKDQVISILAEPSLKCPAFFIDNIGNRTLCLSGPDDHRFFISFSLSEAVNLDALESDELTASILEIINDDYSENYPAYINRFLIETFKAGHGNLIGIIEDTPEAIEAVKSICDGTILNNPIDFYKHMRSAFEEKTVENHYNLRHYSILLGNMINFDGITIMTNNCKIIGYNLFIKPEALDPESSGGARTRAFAAMEKSGVFICAFFKSQDGNEKIYKKDE